MTRKGIAVCLVLGAVVAGILAYALFGHIYVLGESTTGLLVAQRARRAGAQAPQFGAWDTTASRSTADRWGLKSSKGCEQLVEYHVEGVKYATIWVRHQCRSSGGEEVTVHYLPQEPRTALVAGLAELFVAGIVVIGLLLAALYLAVVPPKRTAEPAK